MDQQEKANALVAVLKKRLAILGKLRQEEDDLDETAVTERYQRWKEGTTKLLRERLSETEAKKFSGVRPVMRFPGNLRPPFWIRDGGTARSVLTALIRDLEERPEEVLELAESNKKRPSIVGSGVRVFISHSSKDAALAKRVVQLLRSALNLEPKAIRCTSVDGCRLPVGANTDAIIRDEVLGADVVLGIISTASLESLYVVFELGARWGAGRDLSPLIAPGVDPSAMKAPLGGTNALRADSPAELHQLVTDIGRKLGIGPNPAASYQSEIDEIIKLPLPPKEAEKGDARPDADAGAPTRSGEASDEELKLLEALSENDMEVGASDLQTSLKVTAGRAQFILETLEKRGLLVGVHFWTGAESRYSLSAAGRSLLARVGRL